MRDRVIIIGELTSDSHFSQRFLETLGLNHLLSEEELSHFAETNNYKLVSPMDMSQLREVERTLELISEGYEGVVISLNNLAYLPRDDSYEKLLIELLGASERRGITLIFAGELWREALLRLLQVIW